KVLIPVSSDIDNKTLSILNLLSRFKNIKIRTFNNLNTTFFNPATFADIKKSDACFLIGTNLKIENPILQIRLRNQFLKGNFLIYTFGVPFKNTIPTNFINLTLISFFKICTGKTNFQQILSFYKAPFFFFGKNLLNRINLDNIISMIYSVNKKSQFLIIDNTPNLLAFSSFNLKQLNEKDIKWADIILGISLNDSYAIRKIILNKHKFIIWANTHGNNLAEKANLILPI